MPEHHLSSEHNGKTVRAAVGDGLVLQLSERPTTGYRWQFEDMPDGLKVLGDDFALAGSAPGAGGQRSLRLNAAEAGRYVLAASLRRGGEAGSEPKARFAVTVEVA